MRLPDAVRDCVVYLYDGDVLLGTAFVVGHPMSDPPGSTYLYVATARHLVEGRRSLQARVNTTAGGSVLVPIPNHLWWTSDDPYADVAIGDFPTNSAGVVVAAVDARMFADDAFAAERGIGPGDEIAFTGLFQGAPGQDRNLPIVRFGQIARMSDELIRTIGPDGTQQLVRAIMVEARSWGGHSGSPAFVLFPATRHPGYIDLPEWPIKDQRLVWALLGLVSAHWSLPADVLRKNEPATAQVPDQEVRVNAGIALVAPAQQLLDLLNRPDVAARRNGPGPEPVR